MITSKNLLDTTMYIGSTTNYKRRMNEHKCRCNNEKSTGYNSFLYQYIRHNGGWDAFDSEIIHEFECEDNKQKRMIEQEYINKFGNGLNSWRSFQTKDERKEQKKEYYQRKKNTENKI